MDDGAVVIIGNSVALKLALDAVGDVVRGASVFQFPSQAPPFLENMPRRWVRVVLVELTGDVDGGVALIRQLREGGPQERIPVAAWAENVSQSVVAEAHAAGANSVVSLTGETSEDAARLASLIHYWCVDNRAPAWEA